jgi:hypothetical protein
VELIKRERLEVQRKEQAEEKRLRKIADHVGAMAYFTDLIKVCECVCVRARGVRGSVGVGLRCVVVVVCQSAHRVMEPFALLHARPRCNVCLYVRVHEQECMWMFVIWRVRA